MINIISQSYVRKVMTGPKKVVINLIKGLEKIGYPYVVNRRLDSCKRIWIHDDMAAIGRLRKLDPMIKVAAGPNIAILPRYFKDVSVLKNTVYLQPSNWVIEYWKFLGFNVCPLQRWPVGIDTDEYAPYSGLKSHVLIYFKQRYPEELDAIQNILGEKKIPYKTIIYGSYKEKDYKELLSKSRYVIWVGRHETQGIALEEALACNIPMLVWDVKTLNHWSAPKREMQIYTDKERAYEPVTAAEYFNNQCGAKIYRQEELGKAIEEMESHLDQFTPRAYILDNLSLEKQAKEFINIYEKYFSLDFQAGFNEKLLKFGYWRNNGIIVKGEFLAKDLIRTFLRLIG